MHMISIHASLLFRLLSWCIWSRCGLAPVFHEVPIFQELLANILPTCVPKPMVKTGLPTIMLVLVTIPLWKGYKSAQNRHTIVAFQDLCDYTKLKLLLFSLLHKSMTSSCKYMISSSIAQLLDAYHSFVQN